MTGDPASLRSLLIELTRRLDEHIREDGDLVRELQAHRVLATELLGRFESALFGGDQRTGIVSEMAEVRTTLRLIVWLLGIGGAAVVTTLVAIFFSGMHINGR